MMQFIETLSPTECDCWLEWLQNLNWQSEIYRKNGRAIATKRRIAWFGLEAETNYQENPEFFYAANRIEKEETLVDLRHRFYREADSILVYEYPIGVGIGKHTDGGFKREVVLLNLIDGERLLDGTRDGYALFHYGKKRHRLTNGQIIRFDSSIEHYLNPVRWPRYSIQLRVADCKLPF